MKQLTPSNTPQSGLLLADATSADATQAAVVAAAMLMALPLFPLAGSSVARLSGSNVATTGASSKLFSAARRPEEETPDWEPMGAKAAAVVNPAAHRRAERRIVGYLLMQICAMVVGFPSRTAEELMAIGHGLPTNITAQRPSMTCFSLGFE